MFQPLLRLLVTRPQLLLEHAQAYVEWLSSEAGKGYVAWRRRCLLLLAAGAVLLVALMLTGMAVMLWAVLPMSQWQSAWVLLAVPLLPWAMALTLWWMAKPKPVSTGFAQIRQKMREDWQWLREAGQV